MIILNILFNFNCEWISFEMKIIQLSTLIILNCIHFMNTYYLWLSHRVKVYVLVKTGVEGFHTESIYFLCFLICLQYSGINRYQHKNLLILVFICLECRFSVQKATWIKTHIHYLLRVQGPIQMHFDYPLDVSGTAKLNFNNPLSVWGQAQLHFVYPLLVWIPEQLH